MEEDRLKTVEELLARMAQRSAEIQEADRKALAAIEAKLQFSANLLQRPSLGHAGLRGLYRQGVNRVEENLLRFTSRFEEMLDRQDHQDVLLASLMDSTLGFGP